ncbi:DoxX family protein [Spongiibacter nanhainus]|uniref:DoxX family protein n=1 Tax=Spongiibacter nanhainus TaxID=2794344 RepID=A0A7T4UQC9_9GAMM|nr:DoxX family protein [Spongiibacter nanhainus]QQD18561.1 DoxX family protein [Spongiibacter nanhainus]
MKTKFLTAVLSLIFFTSGGAKLAGLDFEVAAFQRWGYPLWFMYFTGAVEVAGALGLLIRPLSALAATGLAMTMLGAVGTHLNHAEWGALVIAGFILALAVTRAWLGREEIRALVARLG